MHSMTFRTILLVLPLITALCIPTAGLAYEMTDCIDCHDLSAGGSRFTIDTAAFEDSVHGEAAECMDCHTGIVDESHTATPGSGTVDCSGCHDQENQHGLGGLRDNRPDCYHCHTRHNIRGMDDPASAIHPDRLEQTCAACHPAQSGQVGYFSWLPSLKIATHPKADLSGRFEMGNCLGCHQGRASHGEAEPVSDDNCNRCHLTAEGQNPMLGVMHPEADPATQAGIFSVAVLYQIVIGMLVVGGMIFFVRRFSGTKDV
jgi:hypothetical protein